MTNIVSLVIQHYMGIKGEVALVILGIDNLQAIGHDKVDYRGDLEGNNRINLDCLAILGHNLSQIWQNNLKLSLLSSSRPPLRRSN